MNEGTGDDASNRTLQYTDTYLVFSAVSPHLKILERFTTCLD